MSAPEQQVYSKPLISKWVRADYPHLYSEKEWELFIYEYQLKPDANTLLYSLSGSDANRLAAEMDFRIVDDQGRVSSLLEIFPLARLDPLQAGVMNFQPRQVGAKELYFQVLTKPGGEKVYETKMAYVEPSGWCS